MKQILTYLVNSHLALSTSSNAACPAQIAGYVAGSCYCYYFLYYFRACYYCRDHDVSAVLYCQQAVLQVVV